MSKAKQRKGPGDKRAGSLTAELGRAERLLQASKWDEAAELLEPLSVRYPRNEDVWVMLGEAYSHTNERIGLWRVADNMLQLAPDEPDNWFNAVGIALMNGMPFSALQRANTFLERFPDDKNAGEIRKRQAELDELCKEIEASGDSEPGSTAEDFVELEQTQMALNNGDYALAENFSRQTAARSPNLVAPLNNLSLVYAIQGRFTEAIAMARQILASHPDNLHALSNLLQYLLRSGQKDEAEQLAEQLCQRSYPGDLLLKQIEGLSFLGKDAAIVELFERAEKQDEAGTLHAAMLYHLVAVAYSRRGDNKRARQLWLQALRAEPGFALARANLDNLNANIGERSGAFPFFLQHWISPRWLEDLVRVADKRHQTDTALKQALDRLLQAHPGLAVVLPLLFERGDPEGRRFALQIASAAQLPVLRDFALGENGTDVERMQAAQRSGEIGLLPRGKPVSMVVKGKRDDVQVFGYEITGDVAPSKLTSQAKKAMQATVDALNQGDFVKAETLAREAIALAPDDPSLQNHLIAALQAQDRDQEAQVIIRQLVEQHPDYLFGRVAMARLCIREGNADEAGRWLEPLLSREKFHYSEYGALCVAQIELLMAEQNFDGAKAWLQMWEQVIPKDPRQEHFRQLLRGK